MINTPKQHPPFTQITASDGYYRTSKVYGLDANGDVWVFEWGGHGWYKVEKSEER